MKRHLFLNIFFNSLITAIFVVLNTWALNEGLEESFIVFALLYGVIIIMGNALFIIFKGKKS